jgi:hypothetical protein
MLVNKDKFAEGTGERVTYTNKAYDKGKAGEERDQEGFVEIVMPHRREHWQHFYDTASLMHETPSIRTVFIRLAITTLQINIRI